jgi:predicted DCC family thiol-disulfide oxidoreductase YuxK
MVSGSQVTDMLFYDGHCGLCHHAVKFVLKHDHANVFRFAPLYGATFKRLVGMGLDDSMIVYVTDGRLLVRSDAWVYILRKLGGRWKILGNALRLIPRPVRNLGYDAVARVRSHLFRRPDSVCPLIPAEWRTRFEP